jgi:hypothetical protein
VIVASGGCPSAQRVVHHWSGLNYLLQILPHGNWAELSLLETIVRNWPDGALINGALRGGLSLTPAPVNL